FTLHVWVRRGRAVGTDETAFLPLEKQSCAALEFLCGANRPSIATEHCGKYAPTVVRKAKRANAGRQFRAVSSPPGLLVQGQEPRRPAPGDAFGDQPSRRSHCKGSAEKPTKGG